MLLTKRYCVSFTLLVLFAFGTGPSVAQSLLLAKTVTIQVTDTPVSTVIQMITQQSGIRFSYDPALIPSSRKVSLNVKNQKIESVLNILFEHDNLKFKEVGNQLVIYRIQVPQQKNNIAPMSSGNQLPTANQGDREVLKPITSRIPDTVFVRFTDTLIVHRTDTLVMTNTVIRHDTIHRTDTVYLDKAKTPKAGILPNPRFDKNSMTNQKFRENNGWFAGLGYSHLFGAPSFKGSGEQDVLLAKMTNSNSRSLMNYSVNAKLGYDFPAWGIESGISYTRLGETFQYDYTHQTGGYYRTDTVESFYTVTGIDTSWYYITDSSYVNIDYQKYSFKNPNAYRYVEIPLTGKLRFLKREQGELYALGGVITSINVGKKALVILDDPENTVKWAPSSMIRNLLFSWQLGLGANLALGSRIGINAELIYRNQLTEQFAEYPLQKKFTLLNVKTGIFVRL